MLWDYIREGTAAGAHRIPIGYNLVFSDILDLFLSERLRCCGHLHFFLFPLSMYFRFFNDDNDPSFACHNYHIQARLAYSVVRLLFFSRVVLSHQHCGRFTLFFNFASASRMQDMFLGLGSLFFLAIGRRSPMGGRQVVSCHLLFPILGSLLFSLFICELFGYGHRLKDDTKIPR
jgi:hypothetical protein